MRWQLLLIAAVMATGCREADNAFSLENPFDGDNSGQVTRNPGGDHAPFWGKSADSIFYEAESFPGVPASDGILLGVPAGGGTARPLLTALLGAARAPWTAGGAISPDGNSIAFFEITDYRENEFAQIRCLPPGPMMGVGDTLGTNSFLREAVLRVRSLASNSPADIATLTVPFAGRTYENNVLVANVAYPFHRLFDAEGVPFFRASWSPDGSRLVYSDGLRLRVWTVGQATSTPIANTDDGILPAWSPDGSLIAFSKPFSGSTFTRTCLGEDGGFGPPASMMQRTIHTPLTRQGATLLVVRPDGTGLRSLGVGEGPAWVSATTIIAQRDNNLYAIAAESGAATIVPNTLRAFEPAISRAGRFLGFARRTEIGTGEGEPLSKGNYDIWVVQF